MPETNTPPNNMVNTETPVTALPQKKGMSTGVKVLIGCGAFTLLAVLCFVIASALGLAGLSKVITEVDNPSKINEAVVVGDVQWTLTQASDLGSTLKNKYGNDDCVANSGKFIKVVVKMKNNSNSAVSVTNLNIYDSANNEYIHSSDVFSCTTDDLFLFGNVNPGIEKTFTTIYEVPSTSSGFKVKVGDLKPFSTIHKFISLGF